MAFLSNSDYAAEEFLAHPLPNYAFERAALVAGMALTSIAVVVVAPFVIASKDSPGGFESSNGTNPNSDQHIKAKSTRKLKSKERQPAEKDGRPVKEISPLALTILNVSAILVLILIILSSSNNKFSARAVFQAPLLTPEECQHVIDMAYRAAERNSEEAIGSLKSIENLENESNKTRKLLLLDPKGWRKDRHASYPTTDLNLVTDPFLQEDRAFLKEKLDKRLAPLIERVYGINPGAIRSNDMFVVRYDGDKGQQRLQQHTDSSHVSFNILLNEDFEGGGTRFQNRWTDDHITVKPRKGEVIVSNAAMLHEGLPITSGTRYILVGFTSVDRINPFTRKQTGLSLFSSWLSLPWMQVKFHESLAASDHRLRVNRASADSKLVTVGKSSKWSDNKYVRSLFNDIDVAFKILGDIWAPHRHVKLVDPQNAGAYLAALDGASDAFKTSSGQASWFQGQQVVVDVDGTVAAHWDTRVNAGDEKFQDL